MEINELQVRLLHAAKTKDQWKVVTSYPKKGEVCLEATTSAGATSFKIKIGDGTRPYCRNTGTPEAPVWDFTSDQVLPYFGTTVITDGTISVANIETYVDGSSVKKKLTFYSLSLATSTVEGVTTLSPVLSQTPYLEIKEGTGIEFTTDETGTPKLLNINVSSSYINDAITTAINALDTPSPLNLAEWDSTTKTLSLYSLSESNGIVSKSSTAVTTIDLSGIAPVQDVQINNSSILSSGTANIVVEGTYNSSTNKIATESTINDAIADLDVTGYNQATIDTTTSNQTTLTVKGIKEDDGKIAADSTRDVNIVMDGTYNASYNKVATQTTVSNAITALDGIPTTVDSTNSANVITSVSESNGVVSSTRKTIVEGNKIDITTPTSGTNAGDIIVSHEDIDTTATDVASTITTDNSSTVDEKELSVITGIKVDAQGHITHIDKDVSTNLVAADIKSPVEMIDDEMWTYRTTGGDITIDKDIANVTTVKGKSLVWNQLVNFPDTSSSLSDKGISVDISNNKLHVYGTKDGDTSLYISLPGNVSYISGHKYYINCPAASICKFITQITGTNSNPQISDGSIIITANTNGNGNLILRGANDGDVINWTGYINIFDLTLMFGAGNEPSTVAEFEALYPLPYYSYTSTPVLINNNASAIESTGFNQWDEEWESGVYDSYTGLPDTNAGYIRSKNKIRVFPSTTYNATLPNTRLYIYQYDISGNYIGRLAYAGQYTSRDFTVADKAAFINFAVGGSENPQTTYNHDICINLSDPAKNGTYEPYEKHTFYFDKVLQSSGSLATVTGKLLDSQGQPTGESVTVFHDGLKSAGNVYDEIKGNVAIKRIGSVDLGTLEWMVEVSLDFNRYIAAIPSTNNWSNCICPKYSLPSSNVGANQEDKTVKINSIYGAIVRDDAYSTASDFKAAMSGVILYYELATPETYILDQTVTGNYIVDDNGTEKLLPEGVDSTTGLPLTTPFSGIITYQSNFKDVVLDTVDKVSKYKNPVRSKEDKPQTTGKVAVYDSDSTVKSSTFNISNTAIDPEGTSNETTVPTVDAVVDYIEDVVDTEVTVQDITTTDDDVSGNGGIRVTNTGTTYDVHHAGITQSADVIHTITPEEGDNNEAVVKLVTGVITDDFGHVKGKEVISSDKLIAADIKAPMTFTDTDTWLIRPTAGSHDVISEDIAKIVELEGNSCVWNQLVDSDTTSVTLMSGRKYYTKIDGTAAVVSGAGSAISVTGGVDMVIDLTLLDIDNLTTVAQVEAWLAEHVGTKPYYAYNAGEILSAQTLGIKTYGQNLLNPTTKQAKLIPYEWEDNSNVYTIKNVPSGATATFTPDATSVAESVTITDDAFDITNYGSGILELSAATADTYVCMKWDEGKDDDVVPYEEHTQDFDDRNVYGKVNGAGEYVQCYPNGLRGIGSVKDTLTADEAVVKIGSVDLGDFQWVYSLISQDYNRFDSVTAILNVKTTAADSIPNAICQNYIVAAAGYLQNYNKAVGVNPEGYVRVKDNNLVQSDIDSSGKISKLVGIKLNYELATPITYTDLVYRDVGIDRPLADVLVNINVNNCGIEEQLLTPYVDGNPTSTAATITMQYKSNFKDAIKDLIDKVNNQKNPVMGVSNTGQTVDKIAIYDSASTVHSSNYSPSNATIVENATGNDIILPSVETIVNYVNTKLSSALTYKGTITQWSDLPTSGQNTGDMYIAANSFTEDGTTYNAGDFFVWNGTGWDIVTGTTSVVNNNPTITPNGTTYQVGTVDGVALQVTTPNLSITDPTASGNSLTYIDSISQTNGLISATKKTIYSASTTQNGVVTLSSGIESTSSEDSRVPTAFDTLTNLNNRDVDSGTISNGIATLSKRMIDDDSESQTYGDWINKTFYPTTKFAAIDDFSTAFGTNYPDLNTIEGLSTTGFLKRTGNNTWILTDDTGKMKWLDEVTSTYTYSDASTNSEELGSYIHNYNGITSIQKAVISNNNYGFRINVPILSSSLATVGTVLKGTKSQGVDTLPTWEKLSIEELDELDNLGSNIGYLKRKAGATTGTYEWELSTPDSTTVATTKNDSTETTTGSSGAGIKVTTNGVTTYHKLPFSAISNDDSTGANAVTIILNGNFS